MRLIYRRTVVDQQGKPVTQEPYAFLRGAKTASDNRLAPEEERTETFTFGEGGHPDPGSGYLLVLLLSARANRIPEAHYIPDLAPPGEMKDLAIW